MKKQTILFLLFFPLSITIAQSEVWVFGYFESQFMGAEIKKKFIQMYTNKLRVDLEGNLSNKISFGANFDFITYHGYTSWNILDYLPESVAAEAVRINFLGNQINPYRMEFSEKKFLDNAYINMSLTKCNITVGKQQISLGTGYAWNPIDFFNTKDILDPTYEQPGHNAIRVDFPVSLMSTLTMLYSPGKDFSSSNGYIQFKNTISHFDISLIAGRKSLTIHDYTEFNQDIMNPNFKEYSDKRHLTGFSTAGEILGFGIWAEYGYNWMDNQDDFQEMVIGTDYTFSTGTYFMAEYYQNTKGKTKSQNYTLNDWMRYLAQEQKAVARDQLYGFIQHPVTDLINLGISSIYCINDHSIALIPTLNWNAFQNLELTAYLNLYLGDATDIFNQNMGNGGLIRARVYF